MTLSLEFLDPRTDRAAIAAVWQDLAAVCPHSYFLSSGWIDTWLDRLPAESGVRLAVLRDGAEPAAAAFAGHARVVRQRLFRSLAYLLNQTGNRTFDQLYVEDNGFLCRPGFDLGLADLLASLPGDWEELCLSGIDPRGAAGRLLDRVPPPYRLLIANRIPAPYVDLAALARSRKDYLAALGPNTRSQIRRCYKLYESRGALATEIAADAAAALDIFDELVVLHQRSWRERGQRGAFANQWFHGFHRSLIERRFDAGEIQLVRVHCGAAVVGCLYNFVWNGAVSFYQGGFRSEDDNRFKPGFVCHTEAIRHSLTRGHEIYDFMASFDEYKVRMATHQRELVWARVQKPRVKFAIERVLRAGALRAIAQYRKTRSGRKRPPRSQAAESPC